MWKELEAHLSTPNFLPEKGILKTEYVDEYNLEIWFEEDKDVSIYQLDFLPILSADDSGKALKPLLDKERFCQVIGRYNLTWFDPDSGEYNENAIDISPEAIKWFCKEYGEVVKT